MKNLIYIFGIFFTFLYTQLLAQCPLTDIVIKSQTELNQLFNNYPNCHKITKSITFANTTNASLTDLRPMLKIDSIMGDLVLKINNTPNIEGLSKIKYVGGNLSIQTNNALISIPDFDSLKQVNKSISIISNPKLKSIKGFDNLSIAGSIDISNNVLIDTIDAFHQLYELQNNLNLNNLKNLEVVNGFDSLITTGQSILISLLDSPKLKVLPTFDQLRYVKFSFVIKANLNDLYECLSNLDSIGSLTLNLPLVSTIKIAPKAISIGGIGISDCNRLEILQGFDQLKQVGSIYIVLPGLSQLCHFNELQKANYQIYLWFGNMQILKVFEKLKTAGNIFLYCSGTTQMDFAPQLESVNGAFEIRGPDVQFYNHFTSLTHVQGKLHLYLPSLIKLQGFNELQHAGDLSIGSCSSLQSIEGFRKLQRISGFFFIENNNFLDSINGFENLKYCGGTMKIENNRQLIHITEFTSLDTLGEFTLASNDALPALNGFHHLSFVSLISIIRCKDLKTVTGFENLIQSGRIEFYDSRNIYKVDGFERLKVIMGDLSINDRIDTLPEFNSLERIEGYFYCNNTKLIKVPAFPKLESILGDFTISNSFLITDLGLFPSLRVIKGKIDISGIIFITNLAGLSKVIPTMVTYLKITSNPKLSLCNNRFVCGYLALGKPSQINNNAPGCNQLSEIVCTGGVIKGLAFYDRNKDGIRNNGEPGLANLKVDVNNLDPLLISNEKGLMSLYCEPGNTYSITSLHNPKFKPTTDTAFIYQYDSNDENDTLFYFGFIYEDNAREGKITITSDRARCNTQSKIYINILNESGYDQDGEVKLYYNDLNALSNFDPVPDVIDPLNGFAVWKFYNFQPPSIQKITASLQVPSEENAGNLLGFHATYYAKNNDGSYQFLDSSYYTTQVLCAYDPNDISVSPLGTLYRTHPDQTFALTYTIRFQNIGNDTALDVSLSNLISTDLDRNSLQFIASSHPCNLQLYGDVFEVDFPSIYLPSKSQNEDLSQGFLTYSIQTKEGLPDNTVIGNYAEIYFDQNAPILTNTVTNTLKDVIVATKDEEATLPLVWFPNPVQNQLCLQLEELSKDVTLEVFNQLGQRIYQSTGLCHQLHHLPSGTMLAKVKTSNQSQSFVFIKQ
ncbi:MAG TPA: T9SS type A sorting domain-containing protein [Saprospiraceae bacterium]|nr:T9SS type A sorting domain-containing protein [Saprospiraceae bacterium]